MSVDYRRVSGGAIVATLASVVGWWLFTLVLVPFFGEFPLNDDWIYARAVQDWLAEGHYEGHPFATASLYGQAAWGRLFCLPWGFSFTALRCSTLVLWLVTALSVSASVLQFRAHPAVAALAGGLVLANPLAMNLGYTFMTDVPFMAAMALAGYCYLRALEDPRPGWLLMGSLAGGWGLLIRQFALVLPLAVVLAFLPLAFRLGRREVVRLLPAFLLPWGVAFLVLQFLPSHASALGHTWNPDVLGESTLQRVTGGFTFYGIALVYLALFCAPLWVAPAWDWLRYRLGSPYRRAAGVGAFLVLLALVVCIVAPHRLPYLGNVLYDTGVGPRTMTGLFAGDRLWSPRTLEGGWWGPTLVGLVGAAWMLAGFVRWFVLIPGDGRRPATDARRRQQAFLMLWAVFAIVALYHPWLPVRFDRYLLGALVPVLLLVAMVHTRWNPALAVLQAVLCIGLYGFSLVGLQDYMAWNGARWKAVDQLMAAGVPPEEIDGGYEFNGWYTSPHYIEKLGPAAFLRSGNLGWWVLENTYVVSWRPRPGFEVLEEIPYHSWLAGERGRLLVLKKIP